eukprot:9364518-Karenia_brevis.AAC.1
MLVDHHIQNSRAADEDEELPRMRMQNCGSERQHGELCQRSSKGEWTYEAQWTPRVQISSTKYA